MSRIDLSTREIFLRIATTPMSRSARADKLFRRLRNEEAEDVVGSLLKAPARVAMAGKPRAKAKSSA